MQPRANADELPPMLADLATTIGTAATLKLLDRFGGTRLYVPGRVGDEHPLVFAIGKEAADKLVAVYGRERIDVPRASEMWRASRDADIRDRYRAGETAAELARYYQVTERTIYRILRG